MQIVSTEDNLHEISNPVSWEKEEKYFKMSSTGNFSQSAKRQFDCIASLIILLTNYLITFELIRSLLTILKY